MKSYVILSEKSWHQSTFLGLAKKMPLISWHLISSKSDFGLKTLQKIKPEKIFVPHWSYIIPKDIFDSYECIVFHMTNLPYGRGGSPLQNLIERGHRKTCISAIRVEEGIDTGPVYLKKELALDGTANEIFVRAADIIEQMIIEIVENDIQPQQQTGNEVLFKRRNPQQSSIANLTSLEKVYDYIRMLDCEGYPHAFLETDFFKVEFTKAVLDKQQITANVRITKKP